MTDVGFCDPTQAVRNNDSVCDLRRGKQIYFSIAILHVEYLCYPLQLRKSVNGIKQIAEVIQIVVSVHFAILYTVKINQLLTSVHQINIPQI